MKASIARDRGIIKHRHPNNAEMAETASSPRCILFLTQGKKVKPQKNYHVPEVNLSLTTTPDFEASTQWANRIVSLCTIMPAIILSCRRMAALHWLSPY